MEYVKYAIIFIVGVVFFSIFPMYLLLSDNEIGVVVEAIAVLNATVLVGIAMIVNLLKNKKL